MFTLKNLKSLLQLFGSDLSLGLGLHGFEPFFHSWMNCVQSGKLPIHHFACNRSVHFAVVSFYKAQKWT